MKRLRGLIAAATRRLRELRKARHRQHAGHNNPERIRVLTARIEWWVARKTFLKKKLERAKEQRDPKPEAWMANGHEFWNLTERAQKLLAIAVVRYDLYCTSITRSWGTGSFHERVPTHGFDCAGSRMVEFQRDLRYGNIDGFPLSSILELFGPDNGACADNGAPYTMSEGSSIESLHDNHVHAFLY